MPTLLDHLTAEYFKVDRPSVKDIPVMLRTRMIGDFKTFCENHLALENPPIATVSVAHGVGIKLAHGQELSVSVQDEKAPGYRAPIPITQNTGGGKMAGNSGGGIPVI